MTADAPLPPSPLELGLRALREGRPGDALHAFEQAYHLNPSDPRLHEAVGELYLNQGDLRRAREYLQYAIYLAPSAAGPRYLLALVALQEGRSGDGIELLKSVLVLNPTHEAARRALEAEEGRARAAQGLPSWQPRRRFGEPVLLCPPRQIGPDGRDRPANLRAPHHCVNCYCRPGRRPERLHAYRTNWWNLGLVGMLFGGWPVYLVWTLAARERRFSFEPLYCTVCSSQRRTLAVVQWALVGLGGAFLLTALMCLAAWSTPPRSAGLLYFTLAAFVVAVGCVAGGLGCWFMALGQRGVRLQPVGREAVSFAFYSPEYRQAFESLNGAFVVAPPQPDAGAEAASFLPAPSEEAPPAPTDGGPEAAPPPDMDC